MSQTKKKSSLFQKVLVIFGVGAIGLTLLSIVENSILSSRNSDSDKYYGYKVVELIANKNINNKNDAGETALHIAVKNKDIRLAEIIINSGADVNATTNFNATPLHYGASFASKDIINLLATKGANLNATDKNNKKPIDWAIEAKKTENADLLKTLSKQVITQNNR